MPSSQDLLYWKEDGHRTSSNNEEEEHGDTKAKSTRDKTPKVKGLAGDWTRDLSQAML